jgi:hypothetical protein
MFSVSKIAAAACLAAACSAPATSNAQADKAAEALPKGATAERSGFWSIPIAPDSPAGPPIKRGPQSELTFYAQLAGVSNAEADKRMKAQEKVRPEFERLMRTLRTKERGNYTDVELIHRPDWAYLVYFKRQAAATLARYTKNPRFKARSAPYTRAELDWMAKPWIDRMASERLFTGYGMNARRGTADIDMVVSEAEFADIARKRGWGKPPAFLNLKFGDAPIGPPGCIRRRQGHPHLSAERPRPRHHQRGHVRRQNRASRRLLFRDRLGPLGEARLFRSGSRPGPRP